MKKFVYAAMLLLGLSMMTGSCDNIGKNNLEGYEWLEGEWVANYTEDDYRNDLYDYNDMWNLSGTEIEAAVNKFQGPQMFKVIIDKKHIRYELPGELSNINKKHSYQIVGNPYGRLLVDGNELFNFNQNNPSYLCYHNVVNEYEADVFLQKKVVENKPKEDSKAADAKEEVVSARQTKASNSSKNMDKAFSKAINKTGYISFLTQYRFAAEPYHMVFFPFVFSKDGLEGIMYLVTFTDYSLFVGYYADYKVEGDYLRLTNIVQITDNSNARPKIFKMDKQGDKISLEGRFIRQTTRSVSVEETEGLPKAVVNMLENNENNMHSY